MPDPRSAFHSATLSTESAERASPVKWTQALQFQIHVRCSKWTFVTPWNLDYRSLKVIAPFDRSHTSSYWRSIVTMALSCIVSEIKPDIGRKSRFFHTKSWGPRRNIATRCGMEKLEWCGYRMVKKYDAMFNSFDTVLACDRQTDGQTDGSGIPIRRERCCDSVVRVMHTYRALKNYSASENFARSVSLQESRAHRPSDR